MEKLNNIESIKFTKEKLLITIDKIMHQLDLNLISKKLLIASDEERKKEIIILYRLPIMAFIGQ